MNRWVSLVAVVAGGLMCAACAVLQGALKDALKEPELTLKSVDVSAISFEGLTLLSTVDVKNNIAMDIPLPKIDWDLLVIGNPFVKGVVQSEGSLKSRGTTEVSFPVSVKYLDLVKAVANLTDANARYKLQMTAHIPVPGMGNLSWPFEHEGKIPIMRVPEIAVASAPKTAFTYGAVPGVPTGAVVSFALRVKNNSNVAVTLNNLSYDFKVGGASLSKGGVDGKPRINPGAAETIAVNFPLAASDIVQVGASAITGNFKYTLSGNYKFGLPEFPILGEVGDSFSLQ